MSTILTLDIKLCRGPTRTSSWTARIEVAEIFTLSELHSIIQQLVDFDDDHLHEFFAGRSWRDRKVTFGDPDDEGSVEVPLSDIFPLPKGQKLYYNFDFGDDWLFQIACRSQREQTGRALNRATLIEEKGRKPIQYPSEDD
jgi:hypothetical protein